MLSMLRNPASKMQTDTDQGFAPDAFRSMSNAVFGRMNFIKP